MTHESPTHIKLEHVFFKTGESMLLSDVTMEIEPGTCVLVMGPSGAGKTLLLKVMATILPPSEGDVKYDGRATGEMHDRELDRFRVRHGFAFQDGALWQNATLFENIALPLQYHYPERSSSEVSAKIAELCRSMRYQGDLSRRPSRVAGGERKVVSILRALALDPNTVFLDEPGGGLDSETNPLLVRLLKNVKARGTTLVIASHDAEIASQLADVIAIVDEGRLLVADRTETLVRSADPRIRDILADVFELSSTYDTDLLDILGSNSDIL